MNLATSSGGGISINNSEPTITNCTFIGNSAKYGGGIRNSHSNPKLTNCIFTGNYADNSGGGMYNSDYCNPTLTNCIFRGNSAINGGGLSITWSSSPILTNCIFSGNLAHTGGGMGPGRALGIGWAGACLGRVLQRYARLGHGLRQACGRYKHCNQHDDGCYFSVHCSSLAHSLHTGPV